MIFLESLREPVIPFSMYSRCLEVSGTYLQCKQLVSQLPTHHKNVFNYLTGEKMMVCGNNELKTVFFLAFLREVIAHSQKNGIDPKILATLVCTVFLRVSFTVYRGLIMFSIFSVCCRILLEQILVLDSEPKQINSCWTERKLHLSIILSLMTLTSRNNIPEAELGIMMKKCEPKLESSNCM